MRSSSPPSHLPPTKHFAEFGYLLNRAAHITAASWGDILKKADVAMPTWRVLLALSGAGTITVSELASHTGAELSHLSRIVLTAEQNGLLRRKPAAGDRRIVRVSLTTRGRSTLRKLMPLASLLGDQLLAGIPDSDIEATLRTLAAVYENVLASVEHSSDINRKLVVARRASKRANGISKHADITDDATTGRHAGTHTGADGGDYS